MTTHRWANRDPYPVRTELEQRVDMMIYLQRLFGNIDFKDPATFAQYPILQALNEDGVYTFYDLMGLTLEDIEGLCYHVEIVDSNGVVVETKKRKVPIFQRRCLLAGNAYWHETQFEKLDKDDTAMVDLPNDIEYGKLKLYRVTCYQPGKAIVPFMEFHRQRNHQLEIFRKNTRPSIKDFPIFQDEATWPKTKEKFEVSLKACGLAHLIDPTYKPENMELHEAESSWLYKVCQDRITNSIGKGIVSGHLKTMNCADIWRDLCARFDESMSAELRETKLNFYLTNFRLRDGAWKGPTQTFFPHYKEQYRQLCEISDQPFSDSQMVMFLNQAVQGVPRLETVLTTHKTARRASGRSTSITFNEFLEELTSVAQIIDQTNKSRSNSRIERSVNEHEFEFDQDSDDTDGHQDHVFETNVHDIDTDVEELISEVHSIAARPTASRPPSQFGQRSRPGFRRQGTGNRKKMFLDRETWSVLTDLDKKSWDAITDKGKDAIIKYGGKKTGPNVSRSVNEHETEELREFDDSPGAEGAVTDQEPAEISNAEMNSKKEIREVKIDDTSTKKPRSILKSNNVTWNKNVARKNQERNAEMTINKLLSQHSKYTVRREPGSMKAPDRNKEFREVNMTMTGEEPRILADFRGEVSMAEYTKGGITRGRLDVTRFNRVGTAKGKPAGGEKTTGLTDGGQVPEKKATSGTSSSSYLKYWRELQDAGNNKDVSDATERSTVAAAPRTETSEPADQYISSYYQEYMKSIQEADHAEQPRTSSYGADESMISDTSRPSTAESTRPVDLLQEFKTTDEGRGQDLQIDAQLRMAQQNAETNKLVPQDQSLDESHVQASPFDDDWGEDLLRIEVKDVDFDSGDDDELIMAMYLRLSGGRDGVIETVKKEWRSYQEFCERERIKREQERIRQQQQDLQAVKLRSIQEMDREIERLKAQRNAMAGATAKPTKPTPKNAPTPVKSTKNSGKEQIRIDSNDEFPPLSQTQEENTSTRDQNTKTPTANVQTPPRRNQAPIPGNTRDTVPFMNTIVASPKGQHVVIQDKETTAVQMIEKDGSLRTGAPENQVQESDSGTDLNATTDSITPGTEPPAEKRTKSEDIPDTDGEELREHPTKPGSNSSNSSSMSDQTPTDLHHRLTRTTGNLPQGQLNDDMINSMEGDWKTKVTKTQVKKMKQAQAQKRKAAEQAQKKNTPKSEDKNAPGNSNNRAGRGHGRGHGTRGQFNSPHPNLNRNQGGRSANSKNRGNNQGKAWAKQS